MTAAAQTQLAPDQTPTCRGDDVDPELFFPIVASINQLAAAALTARTHCQPCPIRAACHRAGEGEPHGIWAGVLHVDDGHNTRIDLLQPLPLSLRKAKRS